MKLTNRKNIWRNGISAFAILLVCLFLLPITAKADTTGTVNDTNVNIRSEADATSTSLGKVNSGDKVTIVEEKTNAQNVLWYKITTATGTTGYVRADFITKGDAATTNNNTNTNTNTNTTTTTTTTTTTNVTNVDAKPAYIVGDVVNIRSQASASSDLIAKAQKNTEVTVTGEATASDGYKWYKVTFTADGANKSGFIRSDLLTFTKPTNTPAETNIDSTTTENPDNTTTTEDPGTTETGTDEPAENPDTPATEEPAEVKKGITPLQPFDVPDNLPDGFDEVQLETGEKVWHKGDFYIIYGMNEREITGWYVLDEKNSTYIAYDGLFEASAKKKDKDSSGKIFGIDLKVILIVLIIVIILLLAAVFFMALKLSKGVENDDDYDYDDYDDEEDEDEIPVSSIENSRGRSSREDRASARAEKEPKQSKAAKAKDKFLNYFTTEVDDDAEDDEYYDDVDDDDDIDFIDI